MKKTMLFAFAALLGIAVFTAEARECGSCKPKCCAKTEMVEQEVPVQKIDFVTEKVTEEVPVRVRTCKKVPITVYKTVCGEDVEYKEATRCKTVAVPREETVVIKAKSEMCPDEEPGTDEEPESEK